MVEKNCRSWIVFSKYIYLITPRNTNQSVCKVSLLKILIGQIGLITSLFRNRSKYVWGLKFRYLIALSSYLYFITPRNNHQIVCKVWLFRISMGLHDGKMAGKFSCTFSLYQQSRISSSHRYFRKNFKIHVAFWVVFLIYWIYQYIKA